MQENLNDFASISLLLPFSKQASITRADMAGSAYKRLVVPTDPDIPIVDSAYTNDILLSTDNLFEQEGVQLLSKVEKKINNVLCETCYIYRTLKDDMVKLVMVPTYRACYKYGYPTESEFENMEIGEIKHDKTYTIKYKAYDSKHNIVSFGKNVNYVYTVDDRITEDACVISETLAKAFRKPHMDTVVIKITPEYILRNLYGDDKEYKPLPLPGDIVKDGVVASMYLDDSKSFLAFDDKGELSSDNNYVLQFDGARVIDMEIFSKDPISNIPSLEKSRQEYFDYMRDIVNAIFDVEQTYKNIHHSVSDIKDKFTSVLSLRDMRDDTMELKHNIIIKITTVKDKPLEIGDKLTNRMGGKVTISYIAPTGTIVNEDGVEVDMLLPSPTCPNRENPAQLTEASLTCLNSYLQKYLIKSKDNNKKKKEKILKYLELCRQPFGVELFKDIDENILVEHYKVNPIYLTYKPFDDPVNEPEVRMDSYILEEVANFVNELEPVVPLTIYENGKPWSRKHFLHSTYFMVLANGPTKARIIRSDEGTNAKGNPSKISKDKKKHQSRHGTTAVKQSDLSMNIIINRLHPQDKYIIKNNTRPLNDYLRIMGRRLAFSGEDDYDE